MTFVLKFQDREVLSQQHGTCADCRRPVTKLLVKEPGGRRWMNADQLITGLVPHSCGDTGSNTRRAA